MTGQIETVDDTGNIYGGQFSVGMPFTGSVSWDTALVDVNPGDPGEGRYNEDPTGNLINLTMSVGGLDISTAPVSGGSGNAVILPNNGNFIVNGNLPNTNGVAVSVIEFHVFSGLGTTFLDDSLPTDLDLADFGVTHTLSFATVSLPNIGFVFGSIQTLTLVPEPETGLLLLFAIGLAIQLGCKREARC